jgi:hypothetical protein
MPPSESVSPHCAPRGASFWLDISLSETSRQDLVTALGIHERAMAASASSLWASGGSGKSAMRCMIAAVAGPMLGEDLGRTGEDRGGIWPLVPEDAQRGPPRAPGVARLETLGLRRDQEALLLSHVVDDRLARHRLLVDGGQHPDAVSIEEVDQLGSESAHAGSAPVVSATKPSASDGSLTSILSPQRGQIRYAGSGWRRRSNNQRRVAPSEVIRHHAVHVI